MEQHSKIMQRRLDMLKNNYSHSNVKSFLVPMQSLLRKSVIEYVESCISHLFVVLRDIISDEEEFRKELGVIISSPDLASSTDFFAFNALIEKLLGNMLSSVIQWKKTISFPNADKYAIDTINQLESKTEAFDVLRSCALINYNEKIEQLKRGIPENFLEIFDIIVAKSRTDIESTNKDILLNAIQKNIYSVSQSVRHFNQQLRAYPNIPKET